MQPSLMTNAGDDRGSKVKVFQEILTLWCSEPMTDTLLRQEIPIPLLWDQVVRDRAKISYRLLSRPETIRWAPSCCISSAFD